MTNILISYLPNSFLEWFLIGLSVLFTYILYRTVEFHWPDLYFTSSNKSNSIFATNFYWYFLFRFFPVFFITATIFSFAKSDTLSFSERILSGFFVGIIFATITDGLALKKILSADKSLQIYFNKYAQIASHLITFIFIIIITIIASYSSSSNVIQNMTPGIENVRDNIWSSFLIAFFLLLLKSGHKKIREKIDSTDIFGVSYKKINPEILSEIEIQSKKFNANKNLVKAICIIENLQRPIWFRRFELLKSFLIKKGSYGIMQTVSNGYISDKNSIAMAIEKYFKDTKKIVGLEEVSNLAKKYNNSDEYAGLVLECYTKILPPDEFEKILRG